MKLEVSYLALPSLVVLLLVPTTLARGYFNANLTTLKQALSWSFIATSFAILAMFISLKPFAVPPEWIERTWFLVFVLATVPGISVLGARKPNNIAWNWFILVPLCLVLSLPSFDGTGLMKQIDLEWPRFIGHAFVLLMGVGNYFGTRHSLGAIFYFIAVAGLGLTFTPAVSLFATVEPNTLRMLTSLFLIPLMWSCRASAPLTISERTTENLWHEFRDLFGIVWAKRVMERVNHSASEEKWLIRLQLDRVVTLDSTSDSMSLENSRKRLREILFWQFKRFYDEEWIASNFANDENVNSLQESSDKPL